MRSIILVLSMVAVLALLPAIAVAQTSGAAQLVDPPPQVAQMRQQYEGLSAQQIAVLGFVPEGGCAANPSGPGAMGTHAINQQLLGSQFPNGTMDPNQPPVLLLDQNNKVMGMEWEARDVGQGPMQLFGQTIQIQPPHPGVDEPHYMLHIYFKPDGKVRFGTDPQTEFDPDLSCPTTLPESGGIVSPAQLGTSMLIALVGVLAVVGVTFVVRRRFS